MTPTKLSIFDSKKHLKGINTVTDTHANLWRRKSFYQSWEISPLLRNGNKAHKIKARSTSRAV